MGTLNIAIVKKEYSYNCKIDSIHQTDTIVATSACAVATKTETITKVQKVHDGPHAQSISA